MKQLKLIILKRVVWGFFVNDWGILSKRFGYLIHLFDSELVGFGYFDHPFGCLPQILGLALNHLGLAPEICGSQPNHLGS